MEELTIHLVSRIMQLDTDPCQSYDLIAGQARSTYNEST